MKQFKCTHCGRECTFIINKHYIYDAFVNEFNTDNYSKCPIRGVAEWRPRKPLKSKVAKKPTANSARVPCPFYDTIDGTCYPVLHTKCGDKPCQLMAQHPYRGPLVAIVNFLRIVVFGG